MNWLKWRKSVGVDEEDMVTLSNIPEEIITHILSFLPTKDAIQTSLLSTKWIHLWKTIPNLDFDDRSLSSKGFTAFLGSAYRATLLSNSILDSYRLSYTSTISNDLSHVLLHSCISAAIKRNVRKLDINYRGDRSGTLFFYSSLYNGINTDCITELNLRTQYCVSVRDCGRLSRLKILRLYEITLLNGVTVKDDSTKLDVSFPVLEVLCLYQCRWKAVKVVNVAAPMLSYFSVDDVINSDCKIKIHGASITRMEYTGDSLSGYDLGEVSSVVDGNFHMIPYGNEEKKLQIALLTCRFLTNLSSLKHLTLSTNTIEALSLVEDLQERLPAYNKMIQLTIRLGTSPLHFETFVTLLQSLSVESLLVKVGVRLPIDDSVFQGAELSRSLPHLKVVKFEVLVDDKRELKLAKFLLNNAKNLKKMTNNFGINLLYLAIIETNKITTRANY